MKAGFPTLNVILPVGISFYTFLSMSYTIDVYRGHLKATHNPLDYMLYVAFFPHLVAALRRGGVLIYETFALGNERYGRPSNPEFLLRPGELLYVVEPLSVVAFEQGLVTAPKRALVQRICAVRGEAGPSGPQLIALE